MRHGSVGYTNGVFAVHVNSLPIRYAHTQFFGDRFGNAIGFGNAFGFSDAFGFGVALGFSDAFGFGVAL